MSQPHDNWLLLSLPASDYLRLQPELQRVRLEKGRPLYRPGEKTEYAYFPLDCLIISTVYVVGRDPAAEIAVTGREGVVGLEVLLHDVPIPRIAVVHTTGAALRIRVGLLTHHCAQSRSLRDAFTRYMQALVGQMMQLSICSRHHMLEQQFSRLLLSRLDRMTGDQVDLSHELVAGALGVTEDRLTPIAMQFWRAGLIDQEADYIRVVDRAALERKACDCYLTVREEYDRLLPGWRTAFAEWQEEARTPPSFGGRSVPVLGEVAGDED